MQYVQNELGKYRNDIGRTFRNVLRMLLSYGVLTTVGKLRKLLSVRINSIGNWTIRNKPGKGNGGNPTTTCVDYDVAFI